MNDDADVQGAFDRYETVEWLYDGLSGKVIKWTKENGNDHDDPSVLVWVADADGTVISASKGVTTGRKLRLKFADGEADATGG